VIALLASLAAATAQSGDPLPPRQRLVAMSLAILVLVVVLELVRRRKLREEYSWVWVATSILLLVLAWERNVLIAFTHWIGAVSTVSALFFGAFLFLLALVLQFSVRLSRLTHRHRTLGQRVALLEEELARMRGAPTKPSVLPDTIEPAARRSERDEAKSA
jgi:hypothetical protein